MISICWLKALWRHLMAGLLLACSPVVAQELTVAVATNFAQPMNELAATFAVLSNSEVRTVTGSSGRLYAQIVNGAPFDVFFSADQAKPAALEQAGLVVSGSRRTYAVGSLVLWSTDPDLVDNRGAVLRSDDFDRLAIANPRLAPYGEAAMQVLMNLGLQSQVTSRLVQGENIAQTYQFVATGNAELGFVALAQVLVDARRGSSWPVSPDLHAPIRQDAVLLQRAADNRAAREFLDFMGSAEAADIINRFGYRLDTD